MYTTSIICVLFKRNSIYTCILQRNRIYQFEVTGNILKERRKNAVSCYVKQIDVVRQIIS